MHPSLETHRHIDCFDEIFALKECHSEHGLLRFVGYCNDAKMNLTKCFRAERIQRQDINREKARAKRARAKALEAEWRRLDPEDGLPPVKPVAAQPAPAPAARPSDPAQRLV